MPRSGSSQLLRKQYISVALLVVLGAIAYMDRVTLSIGGIEIRKDLGLSATAIGALLSAMSLGYTVSQLPVGVIIDRVGSRRLLAYGLFLWSIAQAAGGIITSYSQFLIARVFVGIGESPQYPTSVRVISDWFPVRERGLPLGISTTAGSLGIAVAPIGLTLLMVAFGWRMMFVVMGVAGLIAGVFWLWLYRDPPDAGLQPADAALLQADHPKRGPITFRQWLRLFSFRSTWGLALGTLCVTYTNTIYKVWLPGVLEIQYHVGVMRTGIYTTFPMIGGMAGSLVGGCVSDWMSRRGSSSLSGRKTVAIVSLLGLAIFTIATAMATTAEVAVFFMSVSFFFGMAAATAMWAVVTVVSPQSCVASMTSIANFGGYIGGTLSPLIAGMVVDMTGSFRGALLAGAAMAAIGAGVYLLILKRTVQQEELDAGATVATAA
jgi:sugar phosphate permease